MANSKLECKQCRSHVRRTDDVIQVPAGNFCSQNCLDGWLIAWQKQQHEKSMRKFIAAKQKVIKERYGPKAGRKKGKTKADCEKDLKIRKKAAKDACHAFIRYRDEGKSCPCCSKPLGDNYQAGHFWESGNYPAIRFHEDNIHGQRVDCNYFKGGDSGFYRENLIKRIGAERVEWLDRHRHDPVKYTADDYLKIEKHYKQRLKELKKQRENGIIEE